MDHCKECAEVCRDCAIECHAIAALTLDDLHHQSRDSNIAGLRQ
jgi:hypothetical protein